MISSSHQQVSITKSKQRAPWRQQLVDAETGLRYGLRADSTLWVDLFLGVVIVGAGLVFGLNLLEWTILILAMGLSLTSELFRQLLSHLTQVVDAEHCPTLEQASRLGTAAVMIAKATTLVAAALLFTGHWS